MREDSLKPYVNGICSDIWALHNLIKALEKENKYLKRQIEKIEKRIKNVKVIEGNTDNNIEIPNHENKVVKN